MDTEVEWKRWKRVNFRTNHKQNLYPFFVYFNLAVLCIPTHSDSTKGERELDYLRSGNRNKTRVKGFRH